jgi:hypothetical protein
LQGIKSADQGNFCPDQGILLSSAIWQLPCRQIVSSRQISNLAEKANRDAARRSKSPKPISANDRLPGLHDGAWGVADHLGIVRRDQMGTVPRRHPSGSGRDKGEAAKERLNGRRLLLDRSAAPYVSEPVGVVLAAIAAGSRMRSKPSTSQGPIPSSKARGRINPERRNQITSRVSLARRP